LKGILKATVYRLLFSGFSFLVGLFIADLAGTDLFGEISLMTVNAALIYLVTGLGADQALVWHGASRQFDTGKSFTFSFYASLIQLLIFFIIAWLFLFVTGTTVLSGKAGTEYFVYEIIYFSGLVLLDKYVSLLYAQHRALYCNLLLSGITFLFLAILLMDNLQWIDFPVRPFRFFCLMVFSQGLSVLLLFHGLFRPRFSAFSRQDLYSFAGFSLVVFITNLIQFLAYRADFWLIDYFKETPDVGIYALANRFANLLWIIPNILAGLLIPVLSVPERHTGEKEVNGFVRVLNIFNIILAGCIIVVASGIYRYFLPEDYESGLVPLLLMMPGYYFFSVTLILAAYFSARKKLWVNFAGSSICFVIMITADLFLIPAAGIKGAAIANCIAYSMATAFNIFMYARISDTRVFELLRIKKEDWKRLIKLQSV